MSIAVSGAVKHIVNLIADLTELRDFQVWGGFQDGEQAVDGKIAATMEGIHAALIQLQIEHNTH